MVARHVLDVSIAITMSSSVYNLRIAATQMANVSVHPALEETTAQSRYVDRWRMVRTDRHGKETNATAKKAGKASTAMSAPLTTLAML
jgi:hypothetical protein